MPTLQDQAAELSGQIPGLPNLFARKFVNRAFEEVKRERLWSWNIGEGILITPQLVMGGGLVSVTQFSPNITFDATAQGVLNPLALANPPLTTRQFRISGGPVYNLISYNLSNGAAVLDRIYTEASASATNYQIYKVYYEPPSTDGVTPNRDFLRYLSILNPIQGYTIAGKRLYMTREQLNRRDPLRGAQGQPYYAAAYRPTPNTGSNAGSPLLGIMQYELWPGPTFQQALLCQYERQHVDLLPGDFFPNQCSVPLIQYKAFEYAYRWALQNAGRVPELRGVDWRFALSEAEGTYKQNLVKAKRNDNEIMVTVLRPGTEGLYDFWGPIDSNFFQSHGLPAL